MAALQAIFNNKLRETKEKVGSLQSHKNFAVLSQKNSKKDTQSSLYLDTYAKTYMNPQSSYCGEFAKVAKCECGRKYIKLIFCGKEWCPNCQKIFHNRRIARWLPKALTMDSFGYFVFTIPEEVRETYKNKAKLSQLRTYLRRRLKQLYPDINALCRWHWFGDKNPYKYNPHFNIMVASFEKLPKNELKGLKEDYKKALERFSGVKLDKVNIYFHYYSPEGYRQQYKKKHQRLTDEQAKQLYEKSRWHKVKYITRPTHTIYNPEIASRLKNFRNSSIWGKFAELSYEEIEKMAKKRDNQVDQNLTLLQSGRCPKCGKKIKWSEGLYPGSLSKRGKEIGNGYFEIEEEIPSPRGSPRPDFDSLKELLKEKRAQNNWYNIQEIMDSWEKREKKRNG